MNGAVGPASGLRTWGAAALCLVLLLPGCAHFAPPAGSTAPAATPVLDYYEWLGSAPPAELTEELLRLEASEPPAIPVIHSVSLALLISVPGGGGAASDARALDLLNRVAAEGSDVDENPTARQYRQFGILWREVVAERVRRGHLAGEFAEALGEQRQQARELQERNEALQRQIEALKAIEQQMNRREQPKSRIR